MKRALLLMMLPVVLGGCASVRSGESGLLHRYSQSRKLSQAEELLGSGDRAGAARILAAIINAGDIPGVTDEALFRLALLDLRASVEKDGNLQSLQLLKRLKKSYPDSAWTLQAGQLAELLAGLEEVRRQVRNLKSSNQSLTGEINELNRKVDQLKQLDLELEKKRR